MSASDGARPAAEVDTVPMLRVVNGEPTHEELAALVAVLAVVRRPARSDGDGGSDSLWTSRALLFGAPLRPGPGAWRASTHHH